MQVEVIYIVRYVDEFPTQDHQQDDSSDSFEEGLERYVNDEHNFDSNSSEDTIFFESPFILEDCLKELDSPFIFKYFMCDVIDKFDSSLLGKCGENNYC